MSGPEPFDLITLGAIALVLLVLFLRRTPKPPLPDVPGLSLWHITPAWRLTEAKVDDPKTGYRTGEVVGKSHWDLIDRDSDTGRAYEEAMAAHEPRDFLATFRGMAGQRVTMRVYTRPAADGGLDCSGFVVTDIVAECEAATAALERERVARTHAENTASALATSAAVIGKVGRAAQDLVSTPVIVDALRGASSPQQRT